MLAIDGSRGEGGGQVLRSALSLAIVTGQAFRMFNIRAQRAKPGLRWQHLAAVRAAQAVSSAVVEGAGLGATELTFAPGDLQGGRHAFDVGTAGSTTLIAQTLIPALLRADRSFQVSIDGGTHNPMSPPFEFLADSYLPLLRRMGAHVEAQLVRRGFYPAGGGRIELTIGTSTGLAPIELCSRGALRRKQAVATVSRLPLSIAQRELATIGDALGWPSETAPRVRRRGQYRPRECGHRRTRVREPDRGIHGFRLERAASRDRRRRRGDHGCRLPGRRCRGRRASRGPAAVADGDRRRRPVHDATAYATYAHEHRHYRNVHAREDPRRA